MEKPRILTAAREYLNKPQDLWSLWDAIWLPESRAFSIYGVQFSLRLKINCHILPLNNISPRFYISASIIDK